MTRVGSQRHKEKKCMSTIRRERIFAGLRDRVTVLRYTYISCLVHIIFSCNFASHVGPLRKQTHGVCTMKVRSRMLKSPVILARPFHICVVRLTF